METEKTLDPAECSWNRERSDEEIKAFLGRKLAKFDVIAQEIELAIDETTT
jgi:hypothetical protein